MMIRMVTGAQPTPAPRWIDRRLAAFRTVGPFGALVLIPALFWTVHLVVSARDHGIGLDFGTYLRDADALLHGGARSGQPPLLGLLALPFTVLPDGVAKVVAVVLMAACAVLVLAVLGVRDWR